MALLIPPVSPVALALLVVPEAVRSARSCVCAPPVFVPGAVVPDLPLTLRLPEPEVVVLSEVLGPEDKVGRGHDTASAWRSGWPTGRPPASG